MNKWQVYTKEIGTGFICLIRRIDRAEPYALSRRGQRQTFTDETTARLAGHEHVLHLLNTEERFTQAPKVRLGRLAEAERVFGEVVTKRGKTRVKRHRNRGRRPVASQHAATA